LIHVHSVNKGQHVRALVWRQGLLVLADHIGRLLQSQTQLPNIDELGDQGHVLAWQPIVQPDEETTEKAGDLFMGDGVHGPRSFQSRLTRMPLVA
jgi:hypothetical protein